jgi:cyanate lyase
MHINVETCRSTIAKSLRMQDPHIFRMNEAVLHFGQSIKSIVNEKVCTPGLPCSLTKAVLQLSVRLQRHCCLMLPRELKHR